MSVPESVIFCALAMPQAASQFETNSFGSRRPLVEPGLNFGQKHTRGGRLDGFGRGSGASSAARVSTGDPTSPLGRFSRPGEFLCVLLLVVAQFLSHSTISLYYEPEPATSLRCSRLRFRLSCGAGCCSLRLIVCMKVHGSAWFPCQQKRTVPI